MNQRLRRTVLNTPLLTTFLRKRLRSCSCDSLGRITTEAKSLTSLHSRGYFFACAWRKKTAATENAAERSPPTGWNVLICCSIFNCGLPPRILREPVFTLLRQANQRIYYTRKPGCRQSMRKKKLYAPGLTRSAAVRYQARRKASSAVFRTGFSNLPTDTKRKHLQKIAARAAWQETHPDAAFLQPNGAHPVSRGRTPARRGRPAHA